MADVKFLAVLPSNANASDRVTRMSISGSLLENPQQNLSALKMFDYVTRLDEIRERFTAHT